MTLARLFGLDFDLVRRRGMVVTIAAAVAGLALVVAVIFMAMAVQIALAHHVSPEAAALIVAAVAMVVAIAAAVTLTVMVRRTRREIGSAVAASTVVSLAPTAFSLARRHTRLAAMVTAAGVGFWLARRGK
jgi:chromate transport protein ChrA